MIHIALSMNRKGEVMLILTAGAAGFVIDTVLISIGVFSPVPYLFPLPYSPLWMVLLWMNFAATLNFSLKGLQGRYLLSAVLGSIGGPAAYYSGAKLGAMTTIPETGDLLVLSSAWAMAVPALFWLAGLIHQKHIPKSF
jgi:tetrahydromethanopterin S-methyltransferase subunit D